MPPEADKLLIPVRSWSAGSGRFSLPDVIRVSAPLEDNTACIRRLKQSLRAQGSQMRFVTGMDPAADIQCQLRNTALPEGYELHIRRDGIVVHAAGPVGWFYGLHTLADLISLSKGKLTVGVISDEPQFRRRGIYLDCSRGKVPTLETLEQLIEQLGAWKINELQLYVENVFTFRKHPKISRGFSPFTPGDMLAIQAMCRKNHLRFVPSLSSFGHFERTLSLPEYSALGEKPGNWGYPGGTTLCPTDKRSIELVSDLYEEFLPLFDDSDVNACCDETWELGKGRSQRAAKRKGQGRVYLDFILKLHRLCDKHGKRMNIWGDIVLNHPEILPDLPKDIVMLNWDYVPDGQRMPRTKELTRAGLDVMICPGSHGWGSHGTRMDQSFPNVSSFTKHGTASGATGFLMTDWGDFGHRNPLGVSLTAYAWAAAHAWGTTPLKPAAFLSRYCTSVLPEQAAALKQIIQTLGQVEKRTGTMCPYYSFGENLSGGFAIGTSIPPRYPAYMMPPVQREYINTPSATSLNRCISQLNDLPELSAQGIRSIWARNLISDFQLASMLDLTACQRIQAGQSIRAGHTLSPLDRRTLQQSLKRLSVAFEKNWLMRNRTSRLGDNLKIFAACMNELKR